MVAECLSFTPIASDDLSMSNEDPPSPSPSSMSTVVNVLKRSKFWKKRHQSATISDYDLRFQIVYFADMPTTKSKSLEDIVCLWRHARRGELGHVTISERGLSLVTRDKEEKFWPSGITFCSTHPSAPYVFCWVYRHQGAHQWEAELRCHAVMAIDELQALRMATLLKQKLSSALQEYKREMKFRDNVHSCPLVAQSVPNRVAMKMVGHAHFSEPRDSALESIEEDDEIGIDEDCDDDVFSDS